MTRDITAAVKTASQDRVMSPFLFGEFQIDSGTIFVSTLDHDIAWENDLITDGQDMGDAAWGNINTPTTNEQTTHDGQTNCRHIIGDSQYDGLVNNAGYRWPTVLGRKYLVKFKAKRISNQIRVGVWDGVSAYNTLVTNLTPATWTEYTYTYTETAGGSGVYIRFVQDLAGASEFYIDEVSVQEVWLGAGQIGAVSAVEESMALQATGLRMALTGIPSDYVTMVLSEDYQGRPAIVRLGFMDTDLGTIIVDPVIIFQGFIDQMKLTDGDTATIQITCENELIAWQRPNVARYTNADQQALYPGDLGLEFVSQAVEKEIVWGSGPAPVTMYNAYGRGAWVQNYDPFGQPILPDWWNDPPPPPQTDIGGGGPGGAGGGAM